MKFYLNRGATMQPGIFQGTGGSWNKDTLINISSATNKRQAPQRQISELFSPRICILNEKLKP